MAGKKKSRYGAWIIVGVLLLGLAGFGTSGLRGSVRSIGSVGDKEVTVSSYQRALNEQIRALSAQFGQQVSFQQAQAFGIDRVALNQVILLRTLDNESAQLGVSVGDERVFERLQTIPSFQGAQGFNRETYRAALQQAGLSVAEFETGLREETARTLLQGAVVGGVPIPEAYADTLVQYIGETRSITWASVNEGDLTAPVPGATPAAQQEYYDANPDVFTLPESRSITYVSLTPDMIIDDMIVPNEAIERLYNERIDQFVQPERRLVERLVYLDEAPAQDAVARVNAGEATFEELVSDRGLNLSDIDMGDVTLSDLGNAGEAVFAAEAGDILGPFESPLGPALFRVNAVLAAQNVTLDQATPRLRDELAEDAARQFINDSADPVIDLLAGGATLADVAERTNMTLGTINWIPDSTESIAAYDVFRREAAAAEIGQFPEIFDLADGGIFALTLDEIVPPTLPPLDDVRDAVSAAWQDQARQKAIFAKAEEIADGILPQTEFDTFGLTPLTEENFTRRSFIENAPVEFNARVFEMDMGEVRVINADDRALVVRLDTIAAPDLDSDAMVARRGALAENARAGIAQDIFDAYATTAQQRTEQRLNQQTINAVNAQFQ